MTAHEVQQPVTEITCDREGCTAAFRADHPFDQRFDIRTRRVAREAGWNVPPPYGKGSRRGTDFCPEHLTADPAPVATRPAPPRWTSIISLRFSARVHNCLVRNGIASVGQLVDSPEQELADIRNFGPSALAEVRTVLAAHELELPS